MFYDFPKDIAGIVFVAFLTNYLQTRYSIPEGTVVIAKGAFEETS